MPWDKESHLPIVEYWAKSFPYTDGDKNENNESFNAIKSNTLIVGESFSNYLRNNCGYQSKSDPGMIWFPHYFIESFIAQAGEESRDLHTPNPGEYQDNFVLNVKRRVTNQYIPRLHNILPCSIDEK